MKNDTIRDEARDPRHELLCKVVFGEATADEVREIEAALESSAALREQKVELESTLALVRGAYGENTSDELSSDRFEAVLAAAGGSAEVAPEPVAAGRAWYRGPAAVTLAFAATSLAIAGVWWNGQLGDEAPTEDLLARLGDGSDRYRDDGDPSRLGSLRGIGYAGADEPDAEVPQQEAKELFYVGRGGAQPGTSVLDLSGFGSGVKVDEDALRTEEKTVESLGQRVRHLELSIQAEAEAKSREGAFAGYSTTGSADSTALQFDAPTTAAGAILLSAESSDSGVEFEAGRSVFSLDPPGAVDGEADAAAQPPAASPGGPPASVAGAAPNQWIAGANTTHRVPYSREVPTMRRLASGGGGLAVPPPDASALAALGYGGGSEEPVARDRRGRYEDARSSSDDFFLGTGKSPATDPDEVTRHDRTTYRVIVPPKRLPNERPREMFFRFWGDNPFVIADRDAQSTFAADVDTASFTLARKMLREGYLPPREQVRTEEFVNFARADLAPPTEGTFALHGELAPSPFGGPTDRWLLRVGVRAAEIERDARPPLALTFVVDTSGSMKEDNRLELVKHAMRLLVGELDARDSIAIVRFSNQASEVLPPTSAAARDVIETALFQLQPDGSTNAEAGLKLGYGLAERTLAEGVQTRVVFLSDGVANVGQTDQDRIAADVASSAARGIFLNTIGVGLANHNDVFLEQMANEGQGVCDYVGDAKDARRAIVERFVGSFVTVAKDVKIQVEFDPQQVLRWRQLGYENRA
ncbi:MAG: von Willebrand factor type A domain-containing protein, partial [Planctomycetota bacterium]